MQGSLDGHLKNNLTARVTAYYKTASSPCLSIFGCYVINRYKDPGLHACPIWNLSNWIKKMPRTAKIGLRERPRPIWQSSEFFASNYFQTGQHVVLLHILSLPNHVFFIHYKRYVGFSQKDLNTDPVYNEFSVS